MIFQAFSTTIDVVAVELGKISTSDTKGKYFQQNINDYNTNLNKEINGNKEITLKKYAQPNQEVQNYDEKYEVVEKRTENTKTFQFENGDYVQETYFEPVHKKEGDEFVEIDNTLENVSKGRSLPIYENKDGLYSFSVNGESVSIEDGKNRVLEIQNSNANLSTYDVKDNVILYSEVYKNIDMEYRLGGNTINTNFYINGAISQNEISFTINKGNLKIKEVEDALLFMDGDEIVYTYSKPSLLDSKQKVGNSTFSYEEKNEVVEITLQIDPEWCNSVERIYPLIMNTRASVDTEKVSVTSAYNRSLQPNTISQYYDLFVGYDDGYLTSGENFGAARTYLHVAPLNIGSDKLILNASLILNKKLAYTNQWNTIQIGKTNGYVNPKDCTWANRPAVAPVSTTTIRSDIGYQSFDVTSYIEDIYAGKNNTLELKATNESSAYLPNVFYGESSAVDRPMISITYRDAWDVDVNLGIDTFDTEMRIFSLLDKGFEALSFDGIARPDAQVIFELVEKGKNNVVKTFTSKGNANRYFIDPIFITKYIAGTRKYEKDDVNYTSDYIYKDSIPNYDVPYEYKVKVKNASAESSREFRTDAFIKYKVKNGDNLKNIAAFYGVSIEDIKYDNNLTTNIIKEDDVLLVRFKKNNDKVSRAIYTPPIRTVVYKSKYVDRGSNCTSGICAVIDPVNSTTGNYYYEDSDFSFKDSKDFSFKRYYNSTGPQLSNMFGNGFTSDLESYISYDKNGNILYFKGDGRIYEFKKSGNTYIANESDNLIIHIQNEKATIKDKKTNEVFTFDVYGYLETINSPSGAVTKINYDSFGLITSAQIGEKKIEFSYNDAKLVNKVTLPSGKSTSYKYDTNRNLTMFTDTNGNSEEYKYDANNYLVSIKDKNGNVSTKNEYDASGRVIKQVDGNGNESNLTYKNDRTILKNADGSEEVYYFNDNFDTMRIEKNGKLLSSYTYDNNRNIVSKKDSQNEVTQYTYENNRLIRTQYPDGTNEAYAYDANGNVTYKKERDGSSVENSYRGNDLIYTKDEKNKTTSYEYNAQGQIIKETNEIGVNKQYTYNGNMITSIIHSNGLVEYFDYDANGNIVKESDNQGKNTTYVYNANNEVTQKNYYDGTNEQYIYDKNGNVIKYKDRIGGITNSSYDANNNLIRTERGNLVSTKQYNELNQLISEVDEKGLQKTYGYDLKGNRIEETDSYGNCTKYEYDSNDQLIKTIDVFGKEEVNEYKLGLLVSKTDKKGLKTSYEYDDKNRLIKQVNPNGAIETKTYDDVLLIKEVDAKGTLIEYEYDSFGRQIKTTKTYRDGVNSIAETVYDAEGNIAKTIIDGKVTSFTYDVYKNVIATTDSNGNTTNKQYDLDGNVIKEIDAAGNSIIYQYDANKNVIATRDRNGNTNHKTYNTLGQLISEKDELGFVTTHFYNDKNQVIRTVDPYGNETTYSYDEFGNQVLTILVDKVVEKKQFDHYGREVRKENLESSVSVKYNDFNQIVEKEDHLTGLKIDYTYDNFGNVVEEKDNNGLKQTYEYDEYDRKVKSIDAYGRIELVDYDVRDNVVKTEQFDGTTVISKYDNKGNVIEKTDYLGNKTNYVYDNENQLLKEIEKDKTTSYRYDALKNQIEVIDENRNLSSKSVYDKNGNVIQKIDVLGNVTSYVYDAKNQEIQIIDAKGNKTSKQYDAYGNLINEKDALGHTKQIKYNAYGLVEMEVDERGFETIYEYNDQLLLSKVKDANGNIYSFSYNEKRQLTEEKNPNGAITSYVYDTYGRESLKILPNSKKISKEYDALGNVTKEEDGNKTTINEYDKLGRLTKTSINEVTQLKNTYNDKNQIIKSFDANNNKSTFEYDSRGNIIFVNEKGAKSSKEYDVYGNLIKQIDNDTLEMTYSYDGLNRLTQSNQNGKLVESIQYDAIGNEVEINKNGVVEKREFNEINLQTSTLLPSQTEAGKFVCVEKIEYDESGNVIKKTDAYDQFETMKYDANNNIIEKTDKKGIKTLYQYDGLNNLLKVQNHHERYVSYTYDSMNNLTFKKINNKIAEYRYNEDNHLIWEENEYQYVNKYSYDSFGNKTEWTKPDGSKIHYTYDNLGNMLSENENTFTYDSRNNMLSSKNKVGTVTTKYDKFNNKTEVIDTNNNKVTYVYNKDLQVVKQKYAGIEVEYSYTENGKLETVNKNGKLVARYTYNQRNEPIEILQKNTKTIKAYDDMGKLVSQKSTKNNVVILDARYKYDENDNVVEEVINDKTNKYKYNEYDELIESVKFIRDKKVKTTYSFDAFGNQQEVTSSGSSKKYIYNQKNQIERIETNKGDIRFKYDENGNIQKKINVDGKTNEYVYDDLNQLIELKQGQYIYSYKYDAQKERISQTKKDTKVYRYDDWYEYNEQVALMDKKEVKEAFVSLKRQAAEGDGKICSNLVVGANEVNYKKQNEETQFILDRNREYTEVLKDDTSLYVYGEQLLQSDQYDIVNGLNDSVVAKIDGNKIEKISYNDYGNTRDIKKGKGYNGETLDETGLIYLRARYYDPTISRFIQIDNNYAGDKDIVSSQNRYVYSLSNPYKYVDRDGNKAKKKNTSVINRAVEKIKTDKVVEVSTQRNGDTMIYTTRYQSGRIATRVETKKPVAPSVPRGGQSKPILKGAVDKVRKKDVKLFIKDKPKVECFSRKQQEGTVAGAVADFMDGFINYVANIPENIDNLYKQLQPIRNNLSVGLAGMLKSESTWETLRQNIQSIKFDTIFNLLSSNDFDEFAKKYGYKNASDALGNLSGEAVFMYLIGKGLVTVSNSTTGGHFKTGDNPKIGIDFLDEYFKNKKNKVSKSGEVPLKGASGATKKIIDKANINGKRIGDMNKQEIINNIPDNWEIHDNNGFVHIKDEKGITRIRIDPPDKVGTPIDHIHIYDENKNPLDINGNIRGKKDIEVHIPLKKD